MMTTALTGFSVKADATTAVDEALAGLGERRPVAAIAYSGVAYDQQELWAALRARLPTTALVGSSSQGVTIPGRAYEADRFLAVILILSDTVKARSAAVAAIHGDPEAAGRSLAAQLGAPPTGAATTVVFYDPLGGGDISALIAGLSAGGYPHVYGGGAGQPWGRMVRTFQMCGDQVFTDGAVAVCLEGLEAVAELTHGAEGIGLELTATRAEGNQVLELDGRPALDVWCEQLEVTAVRDVENTANWALGIKPQFAAPYEGLVTRAPFGFDSERRSLVFQAPIPVGSVVQVCVRTQAAVLGGAEAMAGRMAAALNGRHPIAALSFECGARPAPFLGGDDAAIEVRGVQAALPVGLPWLGMYAWGELAPVGSGTEFHNYTFPLCVLCEPTTG